jgi:hypothetical protein
LLAGFQGWATSIGKSLRCRKSGAQVNGDRIVRAYFRHAWLQALTENR